METSFFGVRNRTRHPSTLSCCSRDTGNGQIWASIVEPLPIVRLTLGNFEGCPWQQIASTFASSFIYSSEVARKGWRVILLKQQFSGNITLYHNHYSAVFRSFDLFYSFNLIYSSSASERSHFVIFSSFPFFKSIKKSVRQGRSENSNCQPPTFFASHSYHKIYPHTPRLSCSRPKHSHIFRYHSNIYETETQQCPALNSQPSSVGLATNASR